MEDLLLLFAIIAYCVLRRIERRAKECEQAHFSMPVQVQPDPMAEVEAARRSVEEQLTVINKTKDIETAIRSIAVIRSTLGKLADLKPLVIRLSVTVGEMEICKELQVGSVEMGDILSAMEKEWMRQTFKEKADTLLNQAESTSDKVLKEELMREALRSTLKGLEYLPEDEILKTKADLAEQRLASLSAD